MEGKTLLLKNAIVVNVFTEELEKSDILIRGSKIIGVGDYSDSESYEIVDLDGKYVCPGFIDGHMHIESTMLLPYELSRISLPHGTTTVVTDPHEIANVCGSDGIKFMLESSKDLPLHVYVMLPSCVPSTPYDESGAVLKSCDLHDFYSDPRVLGLAEMMNYPGVLVNDRDTMDKINDALLLGKCIDGHAPMLTGRSLDKYIASGISTDHECSTSKEAVERIKKGQWVMIREGTAARNLESLLPLFEKPYCYRCLLVTDDRHPSDLIRDGHIDNIIRKAVKFGKNPVTAIKMATLQAAMCFGLKWTGAIAPGYKADIVIMDNLESIDITDVYSDGIRVVEDKKVIEFDKPAVDPDLVARVHNTVNLKDLREEDFYITPKDGECRVIQVIKGQLITKEMKVKLDFSTNDGIDLKRDILKLCVVERHKGTGHIGKGYINGIGLTKGAIASTVSHDSHNLIIIGTNDRDMVLAAAKIKEMEGGSIFVQDGKVIESMPLAVAGLMTELKAEEISILNARLRKSLHDSGVDSEIEPFMNMAFVSLPVIPDIKMTTYGLIDVNSQMLLDL